ncbi:PBECR2 nuclease fold domain-containing protein [Clostridium carnis]
MENRFCTYKRVGYFREKMAEYLGVEYTGTIYASPGVIKHIKKRHGKHLSKKISGNLLETMKNIIEEPDYVGIYKLTEREVLIELVKKIDTNILIGIEIDNYSEYIYVSTMYPITEGKVNNKLYSGKLIKWKSS